MKEQNYNLWDELDKALETEETQRNTGENPLSSELNFSNGATSYRNTPKVKTLSEAEIKPNLSLDILGDGAAVIPAEDQIYIKLGLLEDHIRNGLQKGTDIASLFLSAVYGIALINRDEAFYREVKTALSA